MTRRILSATRSPMNGKQWLIGLDCGHEAWITRAKRPTLGSKVACEKCKATPQKGDTA